MVPHAVPTSQPHTAHSLGHRHSHTVVWFDSHSDPRPIFSHKPHPVSHSHCHSLSLLHSVSRRSPHADCHTHDHHLRLTQRAGSVTGSHCHSSPHTHTQSYHTVAHSVSQSQAPPSMGCCLLMSRTSSHSCWSTATGPSYTVAWSRTVPRVPPHTLPHGSPLLTGLLLRPRHSSLRAEADRAGPGARSRGTDRAHKGAAAERLRAGASGRWSPALDLSGARHSGNAHQGAAFRGQKSLQDSVPSQVFKSRTHSDCAGAACSGGSLWQGVVEVGCSTTHVQC